MIGKRFSKRTILILLIGSLAFFAIAGGTFYLDGLGPAIGISFFMLIVVYMAIHRFATFESPTNKSALTIRKSFLQKIRTFSLCVLVLTLMAIGVFALLGWEVMAFVVLFFLTIPAFVVSGYVATFEFSLYCKEREQASGQKKNMNTIRK